MIPPRDFEGTDLALGDEVIFTSAPSFLQRGTITGFSKIGGGLMVCEIVTETHKRYVHRVGGSLCAKVHSTKEV